MASIAEGLSIIKHANVGKGTQEVDAETTPLRDPWAYQYDIDVGEVAEVWRRGSVVGSWLVDLTADAFARSPGPRRLRRAGVGLGRGSLDGVGRHRRGRARSGHHRLALRALRVAGLGRFHRQDPLGDAQRVRRPRREEAIGRCSTPSKRSPTPTRSPAPVPPSWPARRAWLRQRARKLPLRGERGTHAVGHVRRAGQRGRAVVVGRRVPGGRAGGAGGRPRSQPAPSRARPLAAHRPRCGPWASRSRTSRPPRRAMPPRCPSISTSSTSGSGPTATPRR